ncbi:MAG TPA: hypothetical protein VK279_15660 [Solirubrobacteraceae bacterium]|nr:hypothetical protein [Solirubrobacteraceae bacterium]
MSVRETYEHVPRRSPLPLRMLALMAVVPVASLVLWLLYPDSVVFVALLAVSVLALVFFGVYRALSARSLERPPGRHPATGPDRVGRTGDRTG